jgi:hypothetical protein
MELFLPSLFVVVIAALLAFVVIPRMGSLILAITSLVALVLAGIHHYNLFYAEYQLSTWQNGIGANAPFFILGLALLFIVGAIYYMFTGGSLAEVKNMVSLPNISPLEQIQSAVQNSVATMPAANTATNPLTEAINTGLKNVVASVAPAPNPTNNRPANNRPTNNRPANNKSQLIPGLNFRASEI